MLTKDQVLPKKYRCSGTSCPPPSTSSKAAKIRQKDHGNTQLPKEGPSEQTTPARGRSPTRRDQAELEKGFWPTGGQNVNGTHPSLDNSEYIPVNNQELQSQTVNESFARQLESMDLVEVGETDDKMSEKDVAQSQGAHSTGDYMDKTSEKLYVESPFEIELLYDLVGAPNACLRKYIDKICRVENELATAMALQKPLYQEELQDILELTAEFGQNLVQEHKSEDTTPEDFLRDPNCSEEEEIKFQQRIVDVQLNFCLDDLEVLQTQESIARSTVILLQRQAKCVKIIQLFRQLGKRQFWTYRALKSLMEQLWYTPFAHLPTRFVNLAALYDLALTITQLPAEKSAFWMGRMPMDIRSYTLLFDTKPSNASN